MKTIISNQSIAALIQADLSEGKERIWVQTQPLKNKVEVRKIAITSIEDLGDFWYISFKGISSNCGSFGADRIYKTAEEAAKHPFAASFEPTDNLRVKRSVSLHGGLYRNPGYDLVNM